MFTDPESVIAELQRRLAAENRSFVEVRGHKMFETIPRCECADGFTVSVQAGYGMYSAPRSEHGPYASVELGFPSAGDHLIQPDAEDQEGDPTKTVYPYVSIGIVADLFVKHGGLLPEVKPEPGSNETEVLFYIDAEGVIKSTKDHKCYVADNTVHELTYDPGCNEYIVSGEFTAYPSKEALLDVINEKGTATMFYATRDIADQTDGTIDENATIKAFATSAEAEAYLMGSFDTGFMRYYDVAIAPGRFAECWQKFITGPGDDMLAPFAFEDCEMSPPGEHPGDHRYYWFTPRPPVLVATVSPKTPTAE